MTINPKAIAEDLDGDVSAVNIRSVAKAWGVPVSIVESIAADSEYQRLIFESTETHSEEGPAPTPFQRSQAEVLVERANRAEQDLSRASLSDLEALATMSGVIGHRR